MTTASTSITPIRFAPSVALAEHYHQQWFLVDAQHRILNQEVCMPLLQAVQMQSKFGELHLRAAGMLSLTLVLDVLEDDDDVRCIAYSADGSPVAAIDEGELAAVWFSHVLAQPCKLLKKDPEAIAKTS